MQPTQKPPERLVESSLTAAISATPVHPPFWHYHREPEPPESLVFRVTGFVMMCFIMFILWAGMPLAYVLHESDGNFIATYTKALTDNHYPLALLGFIVFGAIMMRWPKRQCPVLTFSFDEARQQLTFTQPQAKNVAIEVQVPFSDILWISPTVTSFYGRCGYYRVGFKGPAAEPLTGCLGVEIPVTEMEFHAAWLKKSLGTRMGDVDWAND